MWSCLSPCPNASQGCEAFQLRRCKQDGVALAGFDPVSLRRRVPISAGSHVQEAWAGSRGLEDIVNWFARARGVLIRDFI